MGGSKKSQVTEFANPAFLMKLRKDKVLAYNKEKKKLLDNYTRNVKIIEDAFDQIKESTGIASVDEIVTTFIKTEEQHISLFNYLNLLNNEIDMVEEQNRNIEDEIRSHEMLAEKGEAEKKTTKEKIQKEMDEMRELYQTKQSQITDIENQMIQIRDLVWSMCSKFGESKFQLAVASPQYYDKDVHFNENNVTMYLTELEEYISGFITYLAHREKNPDAHISALPLDIMTNKEFSKEPMAIEALNSNEFMEDDATAEDEIVTNEAEKFRKYEELAR